METPEPGLRYRLRRVLRQIGEQHGRLGELRVRLDAALAAGDRRELADAFVRYRHALGAHFELEESVFFPALHGLHPEHVGELEALGREHGSLLEALARLVPRLEGDPLPGFERLLAAVHRELAGHERREEHIVARLAEPAPDAS